MNQKIYNFTDIFLDDSKNISKINLEDITNIGSIAVIDQSKTYIAGYVEETGYKVCNKERIIFGDHTRIIKYIDIPFITGADGVKTLKLKDEEKCLYKFFYYYLQYLDIPNNGYSRHYKYLKEKKFIKPPIEFQKQVIENLEKIQCLMENKEKQIQKFKDLINAKFIEMFGNPISSNRWQQRKLNEICDVRDGTHDSPKYYSEGYPFVTSKNLINGNIDFSTCNYINKIDYDKINRRSYVDDGDILMPMIGTIGGATIVKKDREFAIKNVALIKFKNKEINNVFLTYLLNSQEMNDYFDSIKKGGIQKFISLTIIRNLPIIVPYIKLQNEFALLVQKITKMIVICEEELDKLNELKKSKMQEFFGGELDE